AADEKSISLHRSSCHQSASNRRMGTGGWLNEWLANAAAARSTRAPRWLAMRADARNTSRLLRQNQLPETRAPEEINGALAQDCELRLAAQQRIARLNARRQRCGRARIARWRRAEILRGDVRGIRRHRYERSFICDCW